MRIGILAVQGDFEAHARAFARLDVETTLVRTPADLAGLDGIVFPGGESTTQLKVIREEGLAQSLKEFFARGGAAFATCAGAILLAREVQNPAQESLGAADMTVTRNAYGRQLASDVFLGPWKVGDEPLEMVFIRAPVIERLGEGWEVLAERDGRPVLVCKGKVLIATFHPELTDDLRVQKYFLKLINNGSSL